ncbi:MAG: hypothetical protein RIA69_20595 [Cyclobacteriaceae bacterium]
MAIITIKVNERTKAGKAFMQLIESVDFVEKVQNSPYDPRFVAKIRKAEKQKGEKVDDVKAWTESI